VAAVAACEPLAGDALAPSLLAVLGAGPAGGMTRYRWLGTYHAWRTRGRETLQSIEPWVKIAVLGAPAAHYLGLSAGWSVAVGVGIVAGAEVAMLLLGAFDYRHGVLERQQRLLNAQDPWKIEMAELLRQIARRQAARALQRSLEER
jgi:hypothetical protein